VAQVLQSTEIEDAWCILSEELLHWTLGFKSYSVLYILWDSSVSIVTRLWTRHLRNHLVSIKG